MYRTSQNIRKIYIYLEWMLSRVLSLTGNHSPPTLPRMFSNTLLITVPGMEIAQILIWTYSYVFLLNCPQLKEPVYFPLWEVSVTFCIFHRHSLTSWSCGFKLQVVQLVEICICFLSRFPWLSSVVLFLPFHAAWPLGFASEAELEDLGLPKVGPGVEVE